MNDETMRRDPDDGAERWADITVSADGTADVTETAIREDVDGMPNDVAVEHHKGTVLRDPDGHILAIAFWTGR